jgi:cytoskeleton-associated protein 5
MQLQKMSVHIYTQISIEIVDIILQMEKNAAAGRTPSSLPMPTPPPVALTISSPDFAPLSPVHTNALNDAKSLNVKSDPTNFNLPLSYTEDSRAINALTSSRGFTSENSFGDQRNERFITGGNLC